MVLADLAKVHAIHWKMLTGARVETPEDEAVFSMMVPFPPLCYKDDINVGGLMRIKTQGRLS